MKKEKRIYDGQSNADLRFDNFVAGKANQFAIDAARDFAELHNDHHGLLLIYGERGSGKSHLSHAIANLARELKPRSRISICHALEFVENVEQAYKTQDIAQFRRFYHSLDLLIIDSINCLDNQARAQEELIYKLDSLLATHKRVVLTINVLPENMAGMGINKKLVSWFSGGLFVTLEPPELELRIAILNQEAKQDEYVLDDGIALFIAKRINSDIRQLKVALKQVTAHETFYRCKLTVETIREAMCGFWGRE